jgi:outer membrane protein TolC
MKTMIQTSLSLVIAAMTLAAAPARAETTAFEQTLDRELGSKTGLTADQVARRATSSSFDVSARRAELTAAAAEVDRALAGYMPKVALSARYTRLSDPGASDAGSIVVAPGQPAGPIAPGSQLVNAPLAFESIQNQYTFQASLTVPISDYFTRTKDRHASAKESHASSRANVTATKRRVATDARIAYYAWVRAKLGVLVADQALAQAKTHLTDANAALEAGSASRADLLRVESQVANSELLLESSKNLESLSLEQVKVAMHDAGNANYTIGEDIRIDLPTLAKRDARSLWRRAVDKRPELEVLRRAQRAQARAADAEKAGYLPRVDLFANAYYSNPNSRSFPQRDEFSSSWDFGAQLTWTPTDIPGASSASKAAEARAAQLGAEARLAADNVRLEVVKAAQDAREQEVAVKTSARGLAAAEESYRVRRILFQNGKATSAELLDAETDLTRARLDALDARVDSRVARVRLAYALGDDVAGSSR